MFFIRKSGESKRLSYPIVYQSYRFVCESCSIVCVFNRIVPKSYPIAYLVKNNVAGTVLIRTVKTNSELLIKILKVKVNVCFFFILDEVGFSERLET